MTRRLSTGALAVATLLVGSAAWASPPLLDAELLDAFRTSLEADVLAPYYPAARDPLGGFIEDRSSSWELAQDADKFLACQARYVWTASQAAAFHARDEPSALLYRNMAAHGFEFLSRIWGGVYDGHVGLHVVVDPDGANGRGPRTRPP